MRNFQFEVEVDIVPIKEQDPRYPTVNLPNAAVRGNRERVRSALKKSGYARANNIRNLRCLVSQQKLTTLDVTALAA